MNEVLDELQHDKDSDDDFDGCSSDSEIVFRFHGGDRGCVADIEGLLDRNSQDTSGSARVIDDAVPSTSAAADNAETPSQDSGEAMDVDNQSNREDSDDEYVPPANQNRRSRSRTRGASGRGRGQRGRGSTVSCVCRE